MVQSLLKSSPLIEGEEITNDILEGSFYKDRGIEDKNKKTRPYNFEIYLHIQKVHEKIIIINAIQFSTDGNVCFVKDFSYPKECLTDLIKSTKEEYNEKVTLGGTMTSHILAK